MYDDVVNDFWKNIFVDMLQKNMRRPNAQRLTLQDCPEAFEKFKMLYPELKCEQQISAGYATWEAFITNDVKIRLYIQNQIKGSLLQKTKGDLEKIADARFPYNPFPEIAELLKNKDLYTKQLTIEKQNDLKNQKQQQLAGEFIKALLNRKFKNSNTIWTLEKEKNNYCLKITKNGELISIPITVENFKQEILELKIE